MKKSKRDFLFSVLSVFFIALLMFAQFSSGMAVFADTRSNDIAAPPNGDSNGNGSVDGSGNTGNDINSGAGNGTGSVSSGTGGSGSSGEISATNNGDGSSAATTAGTGGSESESDSTAWSWILAVIAGLLILIMIGALIAKKRKTDDKKR